MLFDHINPKVHAIILSCSSKNNKIVTILLAIQIILLYIYKSKWFINKIIIKDFIIKRILNFSIIDFCIII